MAVLDPAQRLVYLRVLLDLACPCPHLEDIRRNKHVVFCLDTRWRWVVSLALRPLCCKQQRRYQLKRGLGGPQSQSGRFWRRENILSLHFFFHKRQAIFREGYVTVNLRQDVEIMWFDVTLWRKRMNYVLLSQFYKTRASNLFFFLQKATKTIGGNSCKNYSKCYSCKPELLWHFYYMYVVHVKLNPGLSWQKQHSKGTRLSSPANWTYM
jgi:hypothetical protein